MITKIREKFLEKDIQKLLLMEDSPAKYLALDSLKSQAVQMYKSGKISQKFFYSTFFTFHKDQKFWEIHKEEMRKILKKQLTIPKLGVIIKKKESRQNCLTISPGKFSEYSFFLKRVDKIQSILYTIIVKREKGRRQVRSHFLKVNGRCKIIRKKF